MSDTKVIIRCCVAIMVMAAAWMVCSGSETPVAGLMIGCGFGYIIVMPIISAIEDENKKSNKNK